MTKLSRWVGVLEVVQPAYEDHTPVLLPDNDPFVIRFKVRPLVWLDKEHAVPIRDDIVWNTLSFTKGHDKNSAIWTGRVRSSLTQIDEHDGQFLEKLMLAQANGGAIYAIDEREYNKFITHTVRRLDKVVTVSVPQDSDIDGASPVVVVPDVRESIKIQALLASIGAKMGLRIWIPRGDRSAVCAEWRDNSQTLLDLLPLNYDETTLRTIEQIDVLWLRGRAIVRAFEVEHTTSIYSGILRMKAGVHAPPQIMIEIEDIRRRLASLDSAV